MVSSVTQEWLVISHICHRNVSVVSIVKKSSESPCTPSLCTELPEKALLQKTSSQEFSTMRRPFLKNPENPRLAVLSTHVECNPSTASAINVCDSLQIELWINLLQDSARRCMGMGSSLASSHVTCFSLPVLPAWRSLLVQWALFLLNIFSQKHLGCFFQFSGSTYTKEILVDL